MPRYFILFNIVVNGIVFFSGNLLVYRNKFLYIDFVSYNFTEFIYCNNFLVDSLGFSIYIMSFTNSDSFSFSFPIWMMPFLFLA